MDMRFVDLFTASVGDQVAALLDAFAAVAPGCFDTNHMASCRAACGPAQPPTSVAMFGGLGLGRAPAAPSPPAVTPHKWAVAGGAGGPGPTALEAAGAQEVEALLAGLSSSPHEEDAMTDGDEASLTAAVALAGLFTGVPPGPVAATAPPGAGTAPLLRPVEPPSRDELSLGHNRMQAALRTLLQELQKTEGPSLVHSAAVLPAVEAVAASLGAFSTSTAQADVLQDACAALFSALVPALGHLPLLPFGTDRDLVAAHSACMAAVARTTAAFAANTLSLTPAMDTAFRRASDAAVAVLVHEWAAAGEAGLFALPGQLLVRLLSGVAEELEGVTQGHRDPAVWVALAKQLGRPLVPTFSPFAFQSLQSDLLRWMYSC